MSWESDFKGKFIITTGDGKVYFPLWKNNAVKEITYNIAQFDFPNIKGSLVNRSMPQARQFSIEIYFQGEDNLTVAQNFETSANDSRAWTISHPIFGLILCQPVGLKFDYSGYNVTAITGSILETLGSDGLKTTIIPYDQIKANKLSNDDLQALSFGTSQFNPKIKPVNAPSVTTQKGLLKKINQGIYDIGKKQLKLTEDAGEYLNKFTAANAAVDNLISQPQFAIRAIQELVNFPAEMVTSVKIRLNVLQSQFNYLATQVTSASSRIEKVYYEIFGNCTISTMDTAAITSYDKANQLVTSGELPDYGTRSDVLSVIGKLQEVYNQYLSSLDALQTDNGGSVDSYIPNSDTLSGVDELMNYTIQNLYTIALSSKQERTLILDKDSNLILLAHRLYGLKPDDSTIDTLMKNNNICLNEIMQIRKGRSLVYYI
jgi:hypothetical protein